MPVLDSCHAQVIRALQKDGWTIDRKSPYFRNGDRRVHIDIRATRQTNGTHEQLLMVEVKCFHDPDHAGPELYTAIGQYLVYRTLLTQLYVYDPLYLAVPEPAYASFNDSTIQQVFQDNAFKLVIVDLEQERIVRWIP